MNPIIETLTGMDGMTDQIIATDLLISAKTGVRNCAVAVTEAATPEVHSFLQNQLMQAIDMHEAVTQYMMSKGWYHPYDVKNQIHLDVSNANTVLNIE